MTELIAKLGPYIPVALMAVGMFLPRKKQRALGRTASKWMRATLGPKVEQFVEKMVYEMTLGAMEDNNPEMAKAVEKKVIEIQNKSSI